MNNILETIGTYKNIPKPKLNDLGGVATKNVMKNANTVNQVITPNYNTQIQDILNKLTSSMNSPLNYDYTKDPQYIAADAAAKRNAAAATRNTEEELNAKGILNSTVTSDRLGQIQQAAEKQVTDLLPGLFANAETKRQNDLGNMMNLLGIYQGLDEQTYQRGFNEKQLGLQQSQFEESKRQFDERVKLDRESLIQNAEQFAKQFGLSQQEFEAKVQNDLRDYELAKSNLDLATRQLEEEISQNDVYNALKAKEFELAQQTQTFENALNRVNTIGYVDNQSSLILGVPAGTPTAQIAESARNRQAQLEAERISAGNRIAAIEKEYALRAKEAQANYQNELKLIQEKASIDNAQTAAMNEVYDEFYNQLDKGQASAWLSANRTALINEFGADVYKDLIDMSKSTKDDVNSLINSINAIK